MKVLHFVADDFQSMNSSQWTVAIPSDALMSAGHDVHILSITDWLKQTDLAKFWCAWADIVIIQRVLVKESVGAVRHWTSRGKKVVVSFDDSYQHLGTSNERGERAGNPAEDFWLDRNVTVSTKHVKFKKKLEYDPLEHFAEGISYCAAGIVPSKVLRDDYSPYGNMFYLPNYIDPPRYLKEEKRDHGDEIWIGYGGSLGHIPSMVESGVEEALRNILMEYDNVRFMLIGDQRIVDKLHLPKHKVIFRPYVPYWAWPSMLMDHDIAIAPLWGAFDMRRSFIKALEASIGKLPFVATGDDAYPVYEDFFGTPGHLYVPSENSEPDYDRRAKNWHSALCEAIDNYSDYVALAEGSFETGMKYSVDNNTDSIIDVYERVMNLP